MQQFIPLLKEVVSDLVSGNYSTLKAKQRLGRLNTGEIERAIEEYGQQLVHPLDTAFDCVEWLPYEQGRWFVDFDLWTQKGQSDLTLTLSFQEGPPASVEIEDLHVL